MDNTEERTGFWTPSKRRWVLFAMIINIGLSMMFVFTTPIKLWIVIPFVIISFIWSYTACLGEVIFKLFTPQLDYVRKPKIELLLTKWTITLLVPIGGNLLLLWGFMYLLYGVDLFSIIDTHW